MNTSNTLKGNIMQITINAPDSLPYERLVQRVNELEQSLINEAKFFSGFSKQDISTNDPWTNTNVSLPCVDTGIEDFALNHDVYLYGAGEK
jgi:hypothetical protein